MKCQIKEFSNLGRVNSWVVRVVEDPKGFMVLYQKDDFSEPVELVTQKLEIRYWKSFDVLLKHLSKAGFQGGLVFTVTQQIELC